MNAATSAARYRWGIEAGFLVEKHQGYHYEHAFALNWNAMKGYHYLMRMAHLFNTLARFARHLKALYAQLGGWPHPARRRLPQTGWTPRDDARRMLTAGRARPHRRGGAGCWQGRQRSLAGASRRRSSEWRPSLPSSARASR
jgi:hypothetical protein